MTDMGAAQKANRIVAVCTDCGSTYAARLWPDGEIRLIGTGADCPCGGTEFRQIK